VDAPRVDLVRSGVAVAVRAGAAAPAISTEQEVRAAVLAAPSLSFSTGPSGVYLEKLFERWGILAEVRPRIVVPPPGVAVGSLVADGSAALGFQQLSELMNLPGIQVLGPLPEAIQTLTVFAGGICAGSGAAQGARELLDYLASPQVDAIKQQFGMQPA
jgi:molybdate transport system substrate-binding protein